MLVLSRRLGERLVFLLPTGREVTLDVLGIAGNQVRLGITAPTDIKVHREEVYHRILNEGPISKPNHTLTLNKGNNRHE
jgi:carbon storage regulator